MKNIQARALLEKYFANKCTPDERSLVEEIYASELDLMLKRVPDERNLVEEIYASELESMLKRVPEEISVDTKEQIVSETEEGTNSKPSLISLWPLRIMGAVAAIVVFLSIVTYFNFKQKEAQFAQFADDVNPGTNKATLTLGNGKKIDLSSAKTGVVIDVNKLTYSDGTNLSFNNDLSAGSASNTPPAKGGIKRGYETLANQQLTLTTPFGGQYQVKLPDGSLVWLNAGSTLKFPSNFNNLKQRKVYLSGEAYFEVAKDTLHPFIIKSEKQEVQVVGTHFNVYSYPDEPVVKTTLLEGAVIITNTLYHHPPANERHPETIQDDVKLVPGQEAVLSNNNFQVTNVDASYAVAWKNGEFKFASETLKSIMLKLSRWYNIEVIYADRQVAKKTFSGSISKSEKISEILNMLEITKEVHFKIEGRRVTVAR